MKSARFDASGTARYIEVKTTSGVASAAFFTMPNEIDFSKRHPSQYVLVRVFGYDTDVDSGRFLEILGPVTTPFALTGTEYRAKSK